MVLAHFVAMPVRTFLFPSESVNEGHPEKICDQGLRCSLACGTATKDNMVKIDYDAVVRKAVQGIGYDP